MHLVEVSASPSLKPPAGVVSVINSTFPPFMKIFCQSISDQELGSRDFPDHPVPKSPSYQYKVPGLGLW